MATLLPRGKQQFIDATGAPLVGGKVFHYIPGTTTAKDTFQDSNSTILNTNPIILDGRGEAVIYGTGSYRQVVQDSLGNTIWDQLTADTSSTNNIWGGASGGSANAQTVLAGNFSSQSGQTITFLAGASNTGALTINGIPVVKDTASGPVNLTGGEVASGNVVSVIYDGSVGKFHLAVYPVSSASYMIGANNLSDVASPSTSRTNLGLGTSALLDASTAAQFQANTASKVLSTDKVWTAAGVVTLTDAATITLDLSTFFNAKVTLAGNRTLAVSNAKVGQGGVLEVIQDATGSRTLSYTAGAFVFANATAPTLTTTASARDLLAYQVLNDGKLLISAIKAVA